MFIGGDSASAPLLNISTDLGATWTHSHAGLAGSVCAIAPVLGDPNTIYCGTTSGLYKSTDAGANWTRNGSMTQVRAAAADAAGTDIVYAGTATGVYASTDAGATWQAFNAGLGNTDVMSLALRSGPTGMLYAGTNGGGVFAATPLVGIADRRPIAACRAPLAATIVRSVLFLPDALSPSIPIFLLDISGRQVMALAPGTNDLRYLPAGAYFIRAGIHLTRLVVAR